MKREEFVKSLVLERHSEKEDGQVTVSYSVRCPWFDECKHSDESVVHYGHEDEAKVATIGKVMSHASRDHGIKFEEIPKELEKTQLDAGNPPSAGA